MGVRLFNPEQWDFTAGKPFSPEVQQRDSRESGTGIRRRLESFGAASLWSRKVSALVWLGHSVSALRPVSGEDDLVLHGRFR